MNIKWHRGFLWLQYSTKCLKIPLQNPGTIKETQYHKEIFKRRQNLENWTTWRKKTMLDALLRTVHKAGFPSRLFWSRLGIKLGIKFLTCPIRIPGAGYHHGDFQLGRV